MKHPLFQHKRKDLSEEEYLVEEQPSKKAKKSKLVEAPEEGGFDLLSVEEEIEESDQARVLGKRTREGQEDAPSPVQAPILPDRRLASAPNTIEVVKISIPRGLILIAIS